MILIKLFFKLLALPVVIIVTLIQWVGIFVTAFPLSVIWLPELSS
jgi:hypothetical protein